MEKLAALITKHYKKIFFAFIILSIISGVLLFRLEVNYNLASYLPDDAESTVALEIMEKEFSSMVPNARVVLPDVTVSEALEAKKKLASIDGVTAVLWLDDVVDVKKPLPFIDKALLNEYLKDGTAQFSVTIKGGEEVPATDMIRELLGEEVMLSGTSIQNAYYQRQIVKEIVPIVSIIVPVGVLILALTTTSWILPFLVLFVLGVAILLNMGFSTLLGEISFVTQSTAPVLQLAVSMDYLIFLLNSFERNRKIYDDVHVAMQKAIEESFTAIAASALTTVFGFVALMFMRFGIGIDLGINLAKGVAFSYICALTLFPSLVLMSIKLIDKFSHKRIIPEFPNLSEKILKVRIPMLILALLLTVPCFIAKDKTDFLYGNGEAGQSHQFYQETQKINEIFGENTAIVIVTPMGDLGTQAQLVRELDDIPHVNSIISYVTAVGAQIPDVLVPTDALSLLQSENYSRIILSTDTKEEGAVAFKTVDAVRATCAKYYDEYWVCGKSANLRDMKTVILSDSTFVNAAAIGFVFLTLLFSFKSLTLPFILLFVIENAIWINLAIPYFRGESLVYLGYMIIDAVQLGATIDYAILITDGYMDARKTMSAYDAVKDSLTHHLLSVFTSAVVLTTAGFTLQLTSSMGVVVAIGKLLAVGTMLSFSMVIFALPALLIIFDPLTQKFTLQRPLFGSKKSAEPELAFAAAPAALPESAAESVTAASPKPAKASLFSSLKKKITKSKQPVAKAEPEAELEAALEYEYSVQTSGPYLPDENTTLKEQKARLNTVYAEEDGELKPPNLYYLDRSGVDGHFEEGSFDEEDSDFEEAYIKEISLFVRNISAELEIIREEASKTRAQNEELREEIRKLKMKNKARLRQDELLAEIRDLNSQMSSLRAEISLDKKKTQSQ